MAGVVARVQASDFGNVRAPVLVILSPEDRIVDSRKTRQFFGRWGTSRKRTVLIKESGDPRNHLIVGDVISPENTGAAAQHILSFIRQAEPVSDKEGAVSVWRNYEHR